jgi:hypothetical protein
MRIKTLKRLALGVVAATLAGVAFGPTSAALAAQSNGSAYPVYVVDNDTEVPVEAGTVLTYGATVAMVSSLQTPAASWPSQADATGVKLFIATPGDELNQSQWIGWSLGDLRSDKGAGFIYTPLDYYGDGDKAGNVADIKTNGGTYSMGWVYTANNGVTTIKGSWLTIHVTAGSGDWTFDASAEAATAPAITTQPSATTVAAGANATFTAAASGSPAPTVKWESKSGAGAWTEVAGATSATLTVTGATAAQNGTEYRAVFTNSAGSATTNPAVLTVETVPTAPEEPTTGDTGNVTIPAPAEGETTVTVPAGAANANKTLTAWAWSDPTNLGQVTTDASGNATVDISSLPAGTHTIALAESDFTVVAWGTVEVAANPGDPISEEVDLSAAVTASDLWALEGVPAAIDFGSVNRTQSATRQLGPVKVVDDRAELKGWTLSAAWDKFVSANDEIPASALAIAAKPAAGATLIEGITIGTGTTLAQSTAVSTLEAGALFDADLTFTAPKDAQVGQYNSTLTITLASK